MGWLTLIVLATFSHPEGLPAILRDFGVHARFLVAAPLFILADAFCTPRLALIVQHFRDAGLVPASGLPRFDAALASAHRLASSKTAGILLCAAAWIIAGGVTLTASPGVLPAWHGTASVGGLTVAGWWHALVSLPLLVALFLSWLWRVLLWAQLLIRIADLDLRLVPVHPDRAAGLLFVGYSVRAFFGVALALGAVGAGSVANNVLRSGIRAFGYADGIIIAVVLLTALVVFVGPLLAFSGSILRAWKRGVFRYGALAGSVGAEFERKWFDASAKVDVGALEAQDFSATTDLYQVVSNVYQMRFVPVDLASVLLLTGSTLVPLAPVVLLTIPTETLLSTVKSLLL